MTKVNLIVIDNSYSPDFDKRLTAHYTEYNATYPLCIPTLPVKNNEFTIVISPSTIGTTVHKHLVPSPNQNLIIAIISCQNWKQQIEKTVNNLYTYSLYGWKRQVVLIETKEELESNIDTEEGDKSIIDAELNMELFTKIKNCVLSELESKKMNTDIIPFLPVGKKINQKFNWFPGIDFQSIKINTVDELLENYNGNKFLVSISDIFRSDGGVYVGVLQSGSLNVGDMVKVCPIGLTGKVSKIEHRHQPVNKITDNSIFAFHLELEKEYKKELRSLCQVVIPYDYWEQKTYINIIKFEGCTPNQMSIPTVPIIINGNEWRTLPDWKQYKQAEFKSVFGLKGMTVVEIKNRTYCPFINQGELIEVILKPELPIYIVSQDKSEMMARGQLELIHQSDPQLNLVLIGNIKEVD